MSKKMVSVLILFFWSPVFASTLLESATATGIANTVQEIGQVNNPQDIVNNVKNTVNQANKSLHERVQPNVPITPQAQGNPEGVTPPPQVQGNPEGVIPPPQVQGNPEGVNPPAQAQENPEGANPAWQENSDRVLASDSFVQSIVEENPNSENRQDFFTEQEIRSALSDEKASPREPASPKVKYRSKALIFYKKDCSLPSDCKRSHPVLTNLKNVMFDYHNNRLDFQK